ncbi:MAG: hypothetical protein DCC57_08240 [Chloroflexi bacterium]|nr:MAG: hypothetical protein DCC57_08240 [Chloroflexota bacterium]
MSERLMDVSPHAEMAAAPVAAALPPAQPRALLDRPVLSLVRVNWETVAWVLLFVVGGVARFYHLGVRAMSHDESLHALYSYYLYNAGNYEHNPMMHGPFLFHMNALMYFLFGDNDATARLMPALLGLGVMAMAYLYRRYIGRMGALLAGVMVTISPSLLFHSRYIRNDIYISLFTMMWVYGAMRYLDSRAEPVAFARRMRWLTFMVLGMAFGFIAKENHFMHGAILGVFFAGLALWQVIGRRVFLAAAVGLFGASIGFYLFEIGQTPAALALAGVGIAAALGLLGKWLMGTPWARLRHSDAADLAVVMATAVMPFLAPFGHLLFGWDAMAYATTADLLRSAGLVLVMVALSVGTAYFWFGMREPRTIGEGTLRFGQWAQMMGLFWLIQVLFFTTFLTNTRNGLASGIVGSLGYWLEQQEVARGGQPWYYYIMLGWLYEFLPLLLTMGGGVTVVYWLRRSPTWEPAVVSDLPAEVQPGAFDELGAALLRQHRAIFVALVLWWSLGTWLAYTIAGEKMPWLLTHIALPMCILGGWWLGRVIRQIPWAAVRASGAIWLIGVGPALLVLVAALLGSRPEGGRSLDAVGQVMQWLVMAVLAGGLGYLAWRWVARSDTATALRLLAVGGAGLLLLLTVRFTYMLNYVNYDLVTEYLVYAHGSPDIKRALNEIDLISERTVGARNITVAYDDDSSWPLSWYMRQYPNARFYGDNPTSEAMAAPVVIVGPKNYDKVHPYVERDYIRRTYRLVWWPDQGYFGLTPQRFFSTLVDREKMRRIFDIVFYRRYADGENPAKERDLTQWPNRHDFEMWVRKDIADQIWNLNVTPLVTEASVQEEMVRARTVDVAAVASYSGQMGSLPLSTPRAVAVGPEGSLVIADSGNNRIVVLDPAGNFLFEMGSLCRLSDGEAGGCVDPDGSGPLQLGDGQFNEPWGVAVDAAGQIYVADTWNGRIQVFAPDGAFLRKWGYFNTTQGELGDPMALFGPRGLALDGNGNLLVADTGNKRILLFTPTGELIQQAGGGGVTLGRFEEPTAVAIDGRDGSIFVADAWNRRIQKLDAALQPLAEWPVPSWGSQHLHHKPYLAVTGSGDVYATDPANYRVLVYNSAGGLKAAFGSFGAEMNRLALPNGIAWDGLSNRVIIADADNQRVQVFPALP